MLTPEKIEEIKKELMDLEGEEQQKKLQEVLSTLTPDEREQLLGKQECPFCLMTQGKIPVKTVYEDDLVMGILDINPANKGHVLLFPKDHAALLSQVPETVVGHMFNVANRIASGVFEALNAEGTNIIVANGQVAGQTAPHVIVNIIPRFQGDKVAVGWQAQKIEENEMEEVAEKIRAKIPSGGGSVVRKEEGPKGFEKEETRFP